MDVDALGSSESPVGVSEGGKGRFLPVTFMEVGSAAVVTRISGCCMDGEFTENSAPSVPAFTSIVVVVKAVPVRGSLADLDFFFFLVVTVCPAVVVNRVSGHKNERGV